MFFKRKKINETTNEVLYKENQRLLKENEELRENFESLKDLKKTYEELIDNTKNIKKMYILT